MSSFPRTRRHPRIESTHPCFVERLGEEPLEVFSRTRTIGTGGCCFESEEPLGFRSLAKVSLSVAGRTMCADGRVVYERPRGTGLEIGVEFIRLDPEDRIHLRQVIQSASH
ncbi:MAG: PilZ domain-containing protein [Thermoanaerobaculia bacterium]|nr:PilZ domain-containing protein [Thermoanaerobaculia bacterium]